MIITAPISAGELIDKITILRIKAERLTDAAKLANVRTELSLLEELAQRHLPASAELDALTADLHAVNAGLWDVEDSKRACEREKRFDDAFVALARRVYLENDRRAAIKRQINDLTGSTVVEEKSYAAY